MQQPLSKDITRFNQAFEYLKGEKVVTDKKDFAEKLSYSYAHISSISNGTKELPDKIAKRLEDVFFISAAWVKYGEGPMIAGTRAKATSIKFIAENTIFHVPPDKMGGLEKGLSSAKFVSKLERWCMPGLKGEYLSFSLESKALEPEYSKGHLLVVRELEEPYVIVAGASYVFLKNGTLFPGKVLERTGDSFKLATGKIAMADAKKCYAIIMGVPPAKR